MNENNDRHSGGIFLARLVVGLAQGVALYLLSKARNDAPHFGIEQEFWTQLLTTLRLFATFAPLPLLFGLGNLPLRKLAPWAAISAIAIFAFGWFAGAPAWRNAPAATWLFSLIVIYIVHEFVQAAHDDGKRIASYETYFERSWRHAFQAALALGFVGAFWIVISLGATLFRLIGLEIVARAVFSEFFRIGASAVVFAIGVHLTDRDAGLTRGARQIGLALLSWLGVLMTLILTAFLAALPFTGLEPLWDTKRATILLLNAAATMILLINAAYQAGEPPRSALIRAVVRFSAAPLAGVVALAALGLWLRVNQYGFTPARVLASAELLIVMIYAAGYALAAIAPGSWLSLIKRVNIFAALAVAAILTALMTPIGDPARIAVADQVSRLDRGKVEPDDFDFGFLTDNRSGKWGAAALKQLAARGGDARNDRIALLAKNPAVDNGYNAIEQSFNDRRHALVLIGEGSIPDAALMPTGENDPISSCVASMKDYAERARMDEERARQRERLGERATDPGKDAGIAEFEKESDEGRCPARFLDVDFDGDSDLLLLANDYWDRAGGPRISALLADGEKFTFAGVAVGDGGVSGMVEAAVDIGCCANDAPALRRADRRAMFERLTAAPHGWRDVLVAGARMRIGDVVLNPPVAASELIEALDGAPLPAGALGAAPNFQASAFCMDGIGNYTEPSCISRPIDVREGGADRAIVRQGMNGYVAIAVFDRETGAYIAHGDSATSTSTPLDKQANTAEAKAWRNAERRRLVGEATTVPPLLGDLIIDGKRHYFSYVVPSAPAK